MSSDDLDYYRARADEERKAAADASKSEAVMIHEELARMYDAMARRLNPGAQSIAA